MGHGELKTGESCHSPFSYLSLAMNEVLKRVSESEKKSRGVVDSLVSHEAEEKARALEKQKEEETFRLREQAFLDHFPDESDQLSKIEKIIDALPMKVSPELARRIAVTTWWQTTHQKTPES